MAYDSLREFLAAVEGIGELKTIHNADWNLEIGALTEWYAGLQEKPCLLFDRIPGYPESYKVCTLFLASPNRSALALGMPLNEHPVNYVDRWRRRVRTSASLPARYVNTGPVFEHADEGAKVDLFKFPVPQWGELDGGRYIGTATMVVIKDPESEWVNAGVYRSMIHDEKTLGIFITPGKHGRVLAQRYWSAGKPCPIALTFGQEPATWIAASMGAAVGRSEFDLAGWIREEPVEVVALPRTALPVPATAEIAVEGFMPPPGEKSRIEGPFPEWPGYLASSPHPEPVVEVAAVYHRTDPILTGWRNVRPYLEGKGFPFAAAIIWDHLEVCGIPDVRGVWAYCNTLFVVIALRQQYAAHARQALVAAAGARGQGSVLRYFVTVDDDINVCDMNEVMWALTTRVDPNTDIEILRDTWTTEIDPIVHPDRKLQGDLTASKVLINACRPYTWRDRFPPANGVNRELMKRILDKWAGEIEPAAKPRAT